MVKNVLSVHDIGREMYRISKQHAHQLGAFGSMSFQDFFQYVSRLPYRKEAGQYQLLASPENSLNQTSPVIACANKAILIGSWCTLNKIPFRFVAVTRNKKGPFNHVFPEIYLGGRWCPVDATYPWFQPFSENNFAKREILRM